MLPKKESLTIEFKSDLKKYSDADIFEAVVAFANTEGGDLYLGIEDSGEVSGVHGSHKNFTTVAAFIANNTVPPVSVRAEIIDEPVPVLKISVSKSYSGIVATSSGKVLRRRLKADGTPENVPMYPAEFATRLSDLRLLDYSAMPILEADIHDFDPVEVARLKNVITLYSGDKLLLELSDEELYKALGLVRNWNETFYPTVAGLLLIGTVEALKKYVPTTAASFQVLEGTKVRVNDDMTLPLLATIERIDTYLSSWNPETEMERGLFRMAVPAFDKRAVREAVINAFCHRDYTKMGRVRIALNDEGLTIANPGGFIEGVSVSTLLTAEPHGRNPLLADSLKRIGLAEKTGRGIDRIFEGSLKYGKVLPDYSATTNVTVSLFIPRSKVDPQMAKLVFDEQKRIKRPLSVNTLLVLNALKDSPRSDIKTLAGKINLQETMVISILEQSVEAGMVKCFDNSRGKTYSLSAKVYKTNHEESENTHQKHIDESCYRERILNLAESKEWITRADVAEMLHISGNEAYRLIKKLVDDGKLKLFHKGRYAKYFFINKNESN